MKDFKGNVREVRLDAQGRRGAWVDAPPGAIPRAGQALLAWAPEDMEAALAEVLFPAQIGKHGFLAAPPVPRSWEPGMALALRGPVGKGFILPAGIRRLALAALGDTSARVLLLLDDILARGGDGVVYASAPLPSLPASVEIYPLESLAGGAAWADFIAVDLPAGRLADLRRYLGLAPGQRPACPGQALVSLPMPCGGLGSCGACGVLTRRGWKLGCKDGPVFDLHDLEF